MELFKVSAINFCSYPKLELPLYQQGLVWIGGINNDTESASSNGSGKSTLFKAVSWGLYGDCLDGERGDKLIRDGEKSTEVVVTLLDHDNGEWKVVRKRSKGSPKLQFINPGGQEIEGDRAQIQQKIIKAVGLDFRAFKNTVLYGQGDTTRFAHPGTKDAERKDMLHKIMGTDNLAGCCDSARHMFKVYKDSAALAETELEKARAVLDTLEQNLRSLHDEKTRWETQQRAKISDAQSQIRQHRTKANEIIEQMDQLPPPDGDVGAVNEKIIKAQFECDAIDVDTDDDETELEKIRAVYDDRKNIATAASLRIELLKSKLSELKGGNCSVCTAPLTSGAPKKYIASIKKELKALEFAVNDASGAMTEAECNMAVVEKRIKIAKDKIAEKAHLQSTIAKLKTVDLYEAQVASARHSRIIDDLRAKAKDELLSAKRVASAIPAIRDEVCPYLAQIKDSNARSKQARAAIKKHSSDLKAAQNESAYWKFWSKGFSNQGLPSYMLDGVMPFITDRANHYLEHLTDGDVTLDFSTQRELKSSKGAMRDEINIKWSVEGVDDYPPSGGQTKKMEIATDLALMDLVAEQEGGRLDILMMDEVLDGLDAEGASRVVTLLQKLRKERGTIYVVSHDPTVSEAFERSIWATKKDGDTTLETKWAK